VNRVSRRPASGSPNGSLTLRNVTSQTASRPAPGSAAAVVDRASSGTASGSPNGSLTLRNVTSQTASRPAPGSAAAVVDRASSGTASHPAPGSATALTIRTPAPAPRRRIVAPSPPTPPEETVEERIDRRAKETALPRSGPSAVLASEKARNPLIGKGRRRKNRRHLRTGRKV
jgi:hypothetical protein